MRFFGLAQPAFVCGRRLLVGRPLVARRRIRRRGRIHPHPVDPHRPRDVLEPLLALILEGDVEPPCTSSCTRPETQIPPGSASASRRAATFTPSPHSSVPSMMMSPTLMPTRNSIRFAAGTSDVAVDHRTLELDGALHCCYDAGEFHQQAVAGDPDDATLVRLDLGIDERAPVRLPLGESAGIVRSHESTVARDIGHQDGREPPLHAILTRPAEALDKLQPGGTGLCRHHRSCLHRSSPILQHQPPRRENAPRGR